MSAGALMRRVLAACRARVATDEDGAVTVDWVVMAAAVIVLGILAVSPFYDSLAAKTAEIAQAIIDAEPD